jgi:hypothetical protein
MGPELFKERRRFSSPKAGVVKKYTNFNFLVVGENMKHAKRLQSLMLGLSVMAAAMAASVPAWAAEAAGTYTSATAAPADLSPAN